MSKIIILALALCTGCVSKLDHSRYPSHGAGSTAPHTIRAGR